MLVLLACTQRPQEHQQARPRPPWRLRGQRRRPSPKKAKQANATGRRQSELPATSVSDDAFPRNCNEKYAPTRQAAASLHAIITAALRTTLSVKIKKER